MEDMDELLAFMPEAVIAIDSDQCIVYWNESAERIFGHDRAEIIGQKLDVLIPQFLRSRHGRHVEAFAASNSRAYVMHERREVSGQRRDGTQFPAEVTIVRGKWRDEGVIFAILRDVTEMKLRQAAVLASEQKYRAILQSSPEAILIADPVSGCLTEVNNAAARLFGCSVGDLVGLHQSKLHPEEHRAKFQQTFREHIEIGRIVVPDGLIQRANGDVAPVEISASPVFFNGEMRLVGFFRDMSERVEHESQLRAALLRANAAVESKRMFLANMSHELRTPLNSVIGFSELITREIHGPHSHPSYKEYGGIIKQSGEHLLSLVNDILDLSRIEAGRYWLDEENIALGEIVEEVRRMLATLIAKSGVVFDVDVDVAHRLLADRRAVKQMLVNLLSNALKFTPPGGEVRVETVEGESGALVLRVRDTGAGIAAERLPGLGEPFLAGADTYTKGSGGAGIGLSITKRLIELHGGRMAILSTLGSGTTVDLIFPELRRRYLPDGAASC